MSNYFSDKSAENYIKEAIDGFMRDPPDTDYQSGYLAALLVIQKEAFEPRTSPTRAMRIEGNRVSLKRISQR